MKLVSMCLILFLSALLNQKLVALVCEGSEEGKKRVFWGDLHVHTAYSLDAYSFGTANSPADAYAFARGQELSTADGNTVKLDRPLDFTAVTDHAEWFDFMYLCTDPSMEDHPDCNNVRANASLENGLTLFRQYVNPSITQAKPAPLAKCVDDEINCKQAYLTQWERIQKQTNEAYDRCHFTTFIGYEWSATKNFRHTHRNVIFGSDTVPSEAFDYIRYPTLEQLFELLNSNCLAKEGCDVITIPHNTNMGDGMTFDVEQSSDRHLTLRSRIERLIEIHQEKGNSECLAPLGITDESDCNFEVRLTKQSLPKEKHDYTSAEWEQMRGSYARSLLTRGLAAYKRSGEQKRNPLKLGLIASSDGHTSTPGFVEEALWHGPVFGMGNLDRAASRRDWNPGGLVAIRAEENTRESLFAAMKRREVYATSGPRISLNFEAGFEELSCGTNSPEAQVLMGGEFSDGIPHFRVTANQDRIPLNEIEIIKGTLDDGLFIETVTSLWQGEKSTHCLLWYDDTFNKNEPTYWYVRVKESPSLRWFAYHCRRENRCEDFPDAEQQIRERAWSSPIWYLPDLSP